jgi:hypothetical protein
VGIIINYYNIRHFSLQFYIFVRCRHPVAKSEQNSKFLPRGGVSCLIHMFFLWAYHFVVGVFIVCLHNTKPKSKAFVFCSHVFQIKMNDLITTVEIEGTSVRACVIDNVVFVIADDVSKLFKLDCEEFKNFCFDNQVVLNCATNHLKVELGINGNDESDVWLAPREDIEPLARLLQREKKKKFLWPKKKRQKREEEEHEEDLLLPEASNASSLALSYMGAAVMGPSAHPQVGNEKKKFCFVNGIENLL